MSNYKSNLKRMRKVALLALGIALAGNAQAQLASNPDKFLGNITTSGQVDFGNEKFYTLWNQITCENETKWASVEGTKGKFTWGGGDNANNYANSHKFPFKFHALIWGAQYPSWIEKLNPAERFTAIKTWMDEAKKHFPNLQIIDVVNEAVQGHQAGTHFFEEAMGGKGASGFDWIVKAFEMAHERWPEAILIYNDFNTFRWNIDQYIDLVTNLRDAGAPIDAYGCQSHDLTDCSLSEFNGAMAKLQNALQMPMYSTEYDIGTTDDNKQLQRYKEQIPYMWEQDYVAGVTLWGYIYGRTWTNDGKDANDNPINPGHSGIIKDGKDRPAMTWLREYMASDAAKNAKSPFPGMKKPISLYIKPAKYRAPINEPNLINVDATMHNGATIDKVELYSNSKLVATLNEAPYTYEITPTNTSSKINLKAIVYTNDGKTYERTGGFYGSKWAQHPYTTDNAPLNLPGVLEAENFDMGGNNISYKTSRTTATTASYRDDQENTPIYTTDDGYAIDQPNAGDWFDYSVNVTKGGGLKFEGIVGTTVKEGSSFTIQIYKDGVIKKHTDISVPYTGRKTFTKITGDMGIRFNNGEYKVRIIFNDKAAIDKLYVGVTEEEVLGIENVNSGQPSETLYTVYSTAGTPIGQIKAEDNADAAKQIRELTNTNGVYVIKNKANGSASKIMVR